MARDATKWLLSSSATYKKQQPKSLSNYTHAKEIGGSRWGVCVYKYILINICINKVRKIYRG